MLTQFTQTSRNAKTGAISTTMTSAKACPNDCPLKNAGCYADGGATAINWRKITSGEMGLPWQEFIAAVKTKIIKGALWRHNVAGDLQSDGITIDADKLADLTKANKGKRGFTYTHHNTLNHAANREAVKAANAGGFTVNLSANNLAHADALAAQNIAPVASVLPAEYQRCKNEPLADYKRRVATLPKTTPDGRPVTICPATFIDVVNCANCGLCQNQNRKAIVGFPAHGFRTKKADKIARENKVKA
jgi:hypothetical protein